MKSGEYGAAMVSTAMDARSKATVASKSAVESAGNVIAEATANAEDARMHRKGLLMNVDESDGDVGGVMRSNEIGTWQISQSTSIMWQAIWIFKSVIILL